MNKLWILLVAATGIFSLFANKVGHNELTSETLKDFNTIREQYLENDRTQLERARAIAQKKSKGLLVEALKQGASLVEQCEKPLHEIGEEFMAFAESHPEIKAKADALRSLDGFLEECFSQDVKDMEGEKRSHCVSKAGLIIASTLSNDDVQQAAEQLKKALEKKASE